jgi:hypothetical protein
MSVYEGIVLQKSIFADDQNSAGRGRDFRVQDVRDLTASRKIHRRLFVARLRSYESTLARCLVFSRKILSPATFDFCNTIEGKADFFFGRDQVRC